MNLKTLTDGLNACGKTSGKAEVPNIEGSEDCYPSIESRHNSEDDVSDTASKVLFSIELLQFSHQSL